MPPPLPPIIIGNMQICDSHLSLGLMEGAEGNTDEDVVHLSENDNERHQGDNAGGVVSAPAGVQIELNVRSDEAFEEEPLLSEEPEDQQQEQHEDEGAEEEEQQQEYEHITQPATTIRESLTNLRTKYAQQVFPCHSFSAKSSFLSLSLSLSCVYVCILQRVYTYQTHTTNLFSRLF